MMSEEEKLNVLERAFNAMGINVTTLDVVPGMFFLRAISTGNLAMASTGEYGWQTIEDLQKALFSSEFKCISYETPHEKPALLALSILPLKNPFLDCKSLEEVEIKMDLMDVEE